MKTTLFAMLLTAGVSAQSPTDPPALVRVIRSPLQASSQPYADAHAAVTVLGMTSVSGPTETWLIEAHDSFGSIEDLDKALRTVGQQGSAAQPELTSDDVLAPSRTMIAFYRPGWSYRPEEAMKLMPKARYYHISIYRNRSGDDAAFAELVRSRSAGLDSINIDRPDVAYEVVSGAPSGTYLLLAPLTSLKMLDDSLAARAAEGGKRLSVQSAISREHLLFRVEPRMSYVSDEFASGDPEFWNVTSKPDRR